MAQRVGAGVHSSAAAFWDPNTDGARLCKRRRIAAAPALRVCSPRRAAPRCRQGVRGVGEPHAASDHHGFLRLHLGVTRLPLGAWGCAAIAARNAVSYARTRTRKHDATRPLRCASRLQSAQRSRSRMHDRCEPSKTKRKRAAGRAAFSPFRLWISPRARHGGARARPAASGRTSRPPRAAPRCALAPRRKPPCTQAEPQAVESAPVAEYSRGKRWPQRARISAARRDQGAGAHRQRRPERASAALSRSSGGKSTLRVGEAWG